MAENRPKIGGKSVKLIENGRKMGRNGRKMAENGFKNGQTKKKIEKQRQEKNNFPRGKKMEKFKIGGKK
jgi:hypothetical protein